MKNYEVNGFYGTRNRCIIFVRENSNGSRWYAVEGSKNINCTYEEINEGVNVETISDIDTISASYPIDTISDLVREVYN